MRVPGRVSLRPCRGYVARKGPRGAGATTAVEVRRIDGREGRRDVQCSQQVVGEAHVVHEGPEVRLECTDLRRIGFGAKRLPHGPAAAILHLVNEALWHIATDDQPELIDERRLV